MGLDMSNFHSLLRTIRSFSSSRSIESSFDEILRKDPNNLLVNQTLARNHWEDGKYELAYQHALRATQVDNKNQEMYLIAAAAAYRLADYISARENALLALNLPPQSMKESAVTDTIVFRIYKHLPFIGIHLQSLKSEWDKNAKHHDDLLIWAREYTRE